MYECRWSDTRSGGEKGAGGEGGGGGEFSWRGAEGEQCAVSGRAYAAVVDEAALGLGSGGGGRAQSGNGCMRPAQRPVGMQPGGRAGASFPVFGGGGGNAILPELAAAH